MSNILIKYWKLSDILCMWSKIKTKFCKFHRKCKQICTQIWAQNIWWWKGLIWRNNLYAMHHHFRLIIFHFNLFLTRKLQTGSYKQRHKITPVIDDILWCNERKHWWGYLGSCIFWMSYKRWKTQSGCYIGNFHSCILIRKLA